MFVQATPFCVYSDLPCTRFLWCSCCRCYFFGCSWLPKTLLDERYQYTLPVVLALKHFLPYFFPSPFFHAYNYLQIVKYLFEDGVMYSGGVYVPLCTLYLHVCQVRVTVGDLGLCYCACLTSFDR